MKNNKIVSFKDGMTAYICRLIAVLLFGGTPVVAKYYIPESLNSLSVTSLLFLTGTLCLLPFFLSRNQNNLNIKLSSLNSKLLLLALFYGFYYFFYFWSLKFLSASSAAFFISIAPFIGLIISYYSKPKTLLRKLPLFTSFFALILTGFIIWQLDGQTRNEHLIIGSLIVLFAVICDLLFTFRLVKYSEARKSLNDLDFIMILTATIAVLLLPISIFSLIKYNLSLNSLLAFLFLGGVSHSFAMWLSYIAFKKNDSATNYIMFSIMPLVALFLEASFFDDSIESLFVILGAVVLLSSIEIIIFIHLAARFRYHQWQKPVINGTRQLIAITSTTVIFAYGYWLLAQYHEGNNYYILTSLFIVGILTYNLILRLLSPDKLAKWLLFPNTTPYQKLNQHFAEQPIFYKNLTDLNHTLSKLLTTKAGLHQTKVIRIHTRSSKPHQAIAAYFQNTQKSYLNNDPDDRFEIDRHELKIRSDEALIFPLWMRNQVIGLWILGTKPDGKPFFDPEIEILQSSRHYINLYLAFIGFNQTLQKEVTSKTAELKNSNKKLLQLDSLKDDFIAVASHELRTPVSIIRGYAEQLHKKVDQIPESCQKLVPIIEKNSIALMELTNNILDISRMEAGKFDLKWQKFDLAKALKATVQDFKVEAKAKSINLDFFTKLKTAPITLDPLRLRQVMQNLLSNALKVTPKNGEIIVRLETLDSHYKIEVEDTGPGIPKNKQKLIFEKFQQLEDTMTKHYSGTGLGLNIVQKIIHRFGGKIAVQSNPIKSPGAKFTFTLSKKIATSN